jgi:hypothetical protein
MFAKGKSSVVVLAVGLIAGCGGGGGGASSGSSGAVSAASLNASNQTVASQDVASTALGLFTTSQTALGAVNVNESALYAEAFSQLDRLPLYISDARANATATGVVQSIVYSCPISGSLTVSVSDVDNSSTISTGDSFSGTYTACVSSSGTLNGTLSFRIDALSGIYGDINSSVGVTMSYGNLTLYANAFSASINGALSVAGSKTGTNALTQSIATSALTISANYAGTTRSRSLLNYLASETRTAYGMSYLSSYSVTGTLSSNGFTGVQSVSFNTQSPMVRLGTDAYPYTGVLLITGANHSALRLTALSNALVQEDLDANGDGTYESTTSVNWNTLL